MLNFTVAAELQLLLFLLVNFALSHSSDSLESIVIKYKKYNCPHGVPLWINSQNTSMLSNTFAPVCSEDWYTPNVCHKCSRKNNKTEWISGFECQGESQNMNCTINCCESESLIVGKCVWKPLKQFKSVNRRGKVIKDIRFNPLPVAVKVCSGTKVKRKNKPQLVGKFLKDTGDTDETETTAKTEETEPTVKAQVQPIYQEKETVTGDRLKFHCDGDSIPARVNGKNLHHNNGLFCGKAYPCSKNCYKDVSCTLGKKRHDFISGYNCVAEDSDEEPFKCQLTCCNSSVVELYDCTWHYPTDKSVKKGNNSELVLRRIEFFPYILEVCAVKKLEKPANVNDSTCGWGNYVDPIIQQPAVQSVQQVVNQPVVNQPNGAENAANGQSASSAAEASQSASSASSAAEVVKTALLAGGCSPLDMVFVIDSSHSLLATGFTNELSLVTTIMAYFDYSITATALQQSRMGVVLFGNSAAKSVGLTDYSLSATANSQLIQAVNSLTFLDSVGTDIVGGVESAASMYSSIAARTGVRRVTVLITDGTPTVPSGLTTSEYKSLFSTASSNLQSVTGEEIYAVATTTEGQILTTDFGISASHTSYTDVSSGLPGLAATVVSQMCTPTAVTTTTTTTSSTSTTPTTTSTTTSSSTTTPTTTSTSTTTTPTTTTSSTSTTTTTPTTTTTSTTTTSTSTTSTTSTTTSTTTTTTSTSTTIDYGHIGATCTVDTDCCQWNTPSMFLQLSCVGASTKQCTCFPGTITCSTAAECCGNSCTGGVCDRPLAARYLCWLDGTDGGCPSPTTCQVTAASTYAGESPTVGGLCV